MKQLSSVMLLVVAVGCGGGDRPPVVDEDDDIDAPPSANCLVGDSGAATAAMQIGLFDTTADPLTPEFQILADINQDAAPDIANIVLFDGFGAFMTGGIPAGAQTIQIAGAEANFETCGACVLVIADLDDQGASAEPDDAGWMATAGTINLQVVTQQRLMGTVTNVTFTHSIFEAETGNTSAHPDGCTATIDSIAFDTVPTDASMMKRGGKIDRLSALKSKFRR